MSVITITSNERGADLDASEFGDCCDQRPFAYRWKRNQLISVMCSNAKCGNHQGVLAADVDIAKKWEKYRVKGRKSK